MHLEMIVTKLIHSIIIQTEKSRFHMKLPKVLAFEGSSGKLFRISTYSFRFSSQIVLSDDVIELKRV